MISSAAAIGMPLGSKVGGVLGETFAPEIPVMIRGISMIIFSIFWLSSSVLRNLPGIDNVNLFKHGGTNQLEHENI